MVFVLAWDYSAWVRTYALYLEEKLECLRILRYDIEAERIQVSATVGYICTLKCVQQILKAGIAILTHQYLQG